MSSTPRTQSTLADLQRVRTLFASPERIADSDFLRREIAQRMAERLELIKIEPKALMDAGCGAGADLGLLQQRYPHTHIFGLDASPQLLEQARQTSSESFFKRMTRKFLSGRNTPADLVCSDFSDMPLPSQSLDMLWSNLALHWHAQPGAVFAEWRRVLRVDGLMMFSCFGPDTFKELRQAFSNVDHYPHTLSFADMHDLGDMLLASGFTTPVVDMELITVTYESAEKLLADVRAWGGNPLENQRRGLFGKHAWEQVLRELESHRQSDGRIPLTFEVIYGHAFKPVANITEDGEVVVRFVPKNELRK